MSCQAMTAFDVLTVKSSAAVLSHRLVELCQCALTIFASDLLG